MKQPARLWLVAAAVAVFCGCGGDEPSAPPPASTPPSTPPVSATPIATRPRQNNTAPPRTRQQDTEPEKVERFPGVPADRIFDIGVDAPNVSLLPRNQPDPDTVFALALPERGLDSTRVTITPPAESLPRQLGGRLPTDFPEGFSPVAEVGADESGLPLQIRCDADGSLMVLVPGGVFLQGEDGGDADAAPVHPMQVHHFYMDVHEITVGQYRKFMNEFEGGRPKAPLNMSSPDDHPVLGVPWRDATSYAKWSKKQLPREAEWEKAARGTEGYLYPWGNGRVIWARAREPDQIDPVGSFPTDRSLYGIYDLAGNAREWCDDFYAEDSYVQAIPTDGTVAKDWAGPRRPSINGHRVVRGNAADWQLWHRSSASLADAPPDVGIRCVIRLEPPAEGEEATTENGPPADQPRVIGGRLRP